VRIFAFVAAQKADFPVRTLCRVRRVSTSGFYAYAARKASPPSPGELARAEVARHVARVHKSSQRRYGSPRVTAQLAREGILVNHKAVEAEMVRQGLRGRSSRRKMRTTRRDPSKVPALDLVGRDFERVKLDELWIGDATYIWTDEGWLYLATVIDACSRRLLGWSITDHLRTELCLDAIEAAVATRGGRRRLVRGVVFHTDHGTQYTADAFAKACRSFRITQSMGTVGDSYDKAMVSYCTPCRWLGGKSFVEVDSRPFRVAGIAGGWWVEESDVLVVGQMGGEQADALPGLDGGWVHADPLCKFGDGEQPLGSESFEVAGQAVAAA